MWKPYTVIVLYFIRRKILLFIFQTLFRQICQFFDNFDQNQFLDQTCKSINKKGPNCDSNWFFDNLYSDLYLIDQKLVWVKIVSKQFSLNKVWKIAQFFSNELQNDHSIWFPHRFSFSGPKVTPKGLAGVPDPQVPWKRAKRVFGLMGIKLFISEDSLWV